MKEIRTRVIINGSAVDVWKALLQAENYAKFDAHCHIEGEIKNGGAIRYLSAQPPKRWIKHMVILPPDKSTMIWKAKLPLNLLYSTRTFEVIAKDDHTSELNLHERTSGLLATLCLKPARDQASELEQLARGVKRFIEARP